jgi:hypothetical protein
MFLFHTIEGGEKTLPIVEDPDTGMLLFNDGMENGGQYTNYTGGNQFPVTVLNSRKSMNDAYYVRSDCISKKN